MRGPRRERFGRFFLQVAGRVRANEIYTAFKVWMEANNEGPALSQHKFSENLMKKYERKANNGIWYLRIALRPKV
jgi:hypothetical protein